MKKIFFLVAGVVLLGACETTQTQDETQPTQYTYQRSNIPNSAEKIIKGLEGCTKEFTFETMGLPMGERTIDGERYFEWGITTTRYPENVKQTTCTVNAHVDKKGIVDHIYYNNIDNGCNSIYVQMVRYYRTHPAQNEKTCPNRTYFQGNPNIK